jgi:cyclophilin family peptidyl-prolyl cis-trans isomerase/HEAT repeat protein
MKNLAATLSLALLALAPGCRKPVHTPPAPDAAASASLPAPTSRLAALRNAEDLRDPTAVLDSDLASSQPEVRRAATRALARIDQPAGIERLLQALADADAETLSWAAYGLGEGCEANRDRIARALIARALSLATEPAPKPAALDPWFALARALGQCGSQEAEVTLLNWLDAPAARASSAALGLGDVASRRKRLEEETAAGLLRAAAGDAARDPLGEAFYPFGRLKVAPPRAAEQELEAARARLTRGAEARVFAVRAIGKIGEAAIDDLVRIATTPASFTPAERSEAARALGNMGGRKAQSALLKVVAAVAPSADPVSLTALAGPGFHPLMASIDALEPDKTEPPALKALATLAIPPQPPASVKRRVVALRCGAARVLAGANADDPRLACDPDHGPAEAQARLTVLDRGKLTGLRLSAWRAYLESKNPVRIREQALRMLGTHPEIPDAPAILAHALEGPELGLIATAAELISAYPDRANTGPAADARSTKKKPADRDSVSHIGEPLAKALTAALQVKYPPDGQEIQQELAKAAGAVRLESARGSLQAFCHSELPALREAAQAALTILDGKKAVCAPDPNRALSPAAELDHLLAGPVKVQLQTDLGPMVLVLVPSLAPIAATRIADLVAKGFFNSMTVHRVVPGYVVQFGDPGGDGYGGAGLAPLRCETSPVPFVEGTVGVALSGRDTGSSQIFVTLAPSPHIDGHYAVIGKAEGAWEAVMEGDVIEKASLVK